MRISSKIVFALMILPGLALSLDNDDKVLIDGPEVDLTVGELRQALLTVPEDMRRVMLTQPKKIRDIMDSTYMVKVAARRARQKGLDKDPVIAAKIWNYTQNLLAGAEIKDVQKKLIGKDADYEAAARELYLMEKDKYRKPVEYEASHILLTAENGEDDESLRTRLQQIRAEIEQGKITFAEAAKKYSKDPTTASDGGYLKHFEEGRMVKPFEDALKAMKPGDISQPVKTSFGWHLIWLQDKVPASVRPFDEVKDELIKKVKAKAENDIKIDYWLKVKNDPAAKVDEALFESFVAKPVVLDKP